VPSVRRILGDAGESLTERELAARGWRIVARNARTRYGEIDLVCHDGRGYVFVEVKTRRTGSFVSAVEAFTPRKIARLQRLAEGWLAMNRARGARWRIVAAALTVRSTGTEVQLLDVD
jgi:putative endonuclease